MAVYITDASYLYIYNISSRNYSYHW